MKGVGYSMIENKYLNEEKFQKTEKTITLVAILVMIIGLGVGGFLIYRGIVKPGAAKVDKLKVQLENKKNELESKGVTYDAFTKYSDGESYDLKVITNALDPSFEYCEFSECKNHSLTKEYCAAKNSIDDFATTSLIMIGTFICIATFMISLSIFFVAKRRQILAFSAQQVMPVAQEGIEKIAPTVGKAGASIAKEMAPAYGDIAKEISKGIKEGLKDEEN